MSTDASTVTAASITPTVTPMSSSSPRRFKVACIQMTSGEDMAANIIACIHQIRLAAAEGCKFIATPENTGRMTASTQKKNAATTSAAPATEETSSSNSASQPTAAAATSSAPSAASHPVLVAFAKLASELGVWILIGSIAVRIEGETRVANRSYLIGPKQTKTSMVDIDTMGAATSDTSSSVVSSFILASYDKVHMFDVPTLNGTESYMESSRVIPGSEVTLVSVPALAAGALIGMTICYDLRFPHLYRRMAQAGANMICIPSAFTVVTGQAHWHTLLRARAIETGAFILAPAQSTPDGTTHPGGRTTYGHSLIVGPWGDILADAKTASPTYVTAEIDLDQCDEVRRRIPSLTHDRPFTIVKVEA